LCRAVTGEPINDKSGQTFHRRRVGATAIEYGLIAAGIAVAIIVAVNTVGTDLSSLFGRVSAKLNAGGTN